MCTCVLLYPSCVLLVKYLFKLLSVFSWVVGFSQLQLGFPQVNLRLLPSPDYLLLRVDCITVTESKFTLLAAWQANESEIRDEVLRQGIQFYSESQLTKKMVG